MNVPTTLLGLLEPEPSHGYELKREYDSMFGGGRPLPIGQVYGTLSRLERDGHIEVQGVAPGGGPERKRYVITPTGVSRLQQWLEGRNTTLEGAWFYSDSHNDLPLLELVDNPVAVDPDATLRARATQRAWPVISLR